MCLKIPKLFVCRCERPWVLLPKSSCSSSPSLSPPRCSTIYVVLNIILHFLRMLKTLPDLGYSWTILYRLFWQFESVFSLEKCKVLSENYIFLMENFIIFSVKKNASFQLENYIFAIGKMLISIKELHSFFWVNRHFLLKI